MFSTLQPEAVSPLSRKNGGADVEPAVRGVGVVRGGLREALELGEEGGGEGGGVVEGHVL